MQVSCHHSDSWTKLCAPPPPEKGDARNSVRVYFDFYEETNYRIRSNALGHGYPINCSTDSSGRRRRRRRLKLSILCGLPYRRSMRVCKFHRIYTVRHTAGVVVVEYKYYMHSQRAGLHGWWWFWRDDLRILWARGSMCCCCCCAAIARPVRADQLIWLIKAMWSFRQLGRVPELSSPLVIIGLILPQRG